MFKNNNSNYYSAILLKAVYNIYRDLSLMVKYETFNLCYVGSIPTDLNLFVDNNINYKKNIVYLEIK